jgi:hypothetical protein
VYEAISSGVSSGQFELRILCGKVRVDPQDRSARFSDAPYAPAYSIDRFEAGAELQKRQPVAMTGKPVTPKYDLL